MSACYWRCCARSSPNSTPQAADTKLVLHREQSSRLVRIFLPDSSNEARLVDQIDAHVSKIVELGFLRRATGQQDSYEVRRILKAFVDGQWLAEFDQRTHRVRRPAHRIGG